VAKRVPDGPTFGPYPLGAVIAERHLTFHRRGKRPREVLVRLGRPRPWPDTLHGDWMCTYQVLGLGDDCVRHAVGVDGLQALLLAAHVLPADLAKRAKQEQGECRWLGGPDVWSDDGVRMASRFALPLSKRKRVRIRKPHNKRMQLTRSALANGPRGPRS
jgi:hypothetical protein